MLRRTLSQHMKPVVEHFPHGVTKLTLDNAKTLNAVDHETVQVMRNILFDRLNNKTQEKAFVVRGGGPKAFCSGGDVVSIATNNPAGVRHKFFYTEYQVNHAIGELASIGVPYISLWNGIVMGGGFGVSIHGSHRVCSPRTLFAMPETAIGLFPDVGGSWVLPRLPHTGLGLYLALAGVRLKGADILHAGLGTSYVSSIEALDKLEAALLDASKSFLLDSKRGNALESAAALIETIAEPKSQLPPFSLQPHLDKIQKYFGPQHATLPELLAGLEAGSAAGDTFAAEALAKITKDSPTSVAVSYLAFQRGAKCSTRAEMFEMEYRLSQSMANHNDFYQGVDALLMSKSGAPKWQPASLAEVFKNPGAVEKLFEKREAAQPTWDPRTPEEVAFKYLN